jgi:hypothetical protein
MNEAPEPPWWTSRPAKALWYSLAFLGLCGVLFFSWVFLGMATGIVSMCPTADEWWTDTWLYGLPPALFLLAVWLTWRGPRAIRERRALTARRLAMRHAGPSPTRT